MSDIDEAERSFLERIYEITVEGTSERILIHEVGDDLGMEKAQAGTIAENLIFAGLVELINLSGSIAITKEGIETLGFQDSAIDNDQQQAFQLGDETLLSSDGVAAVDEMVGRIRADIENSTIPFETLEEMVIDLKTISVQLLSPKPKTGIVRAVLQSLETAVKNAGMVDIAESIRVLKG